MAAKKTTIAKRQGASAAPAASNKKVLRPDQGQKAGKLRRVIGVAPATMSEILRSIDPKSRGRLVNSRAISPDVVRTILTQRGYSYPKQAKIITVWISKGGNGKTTLTRFIGEFLACYGFKVLLIDTDMQANLTAAFHLPSLGFDLDARTPILADVLRKRLTLEDTIVHVTPHLDLVPSTDLNSTIDLDIDKGYPNPLSALQKCVWPLRSKYDFILIDCPPAISRANSAAVAAADQVLIPFAPDEFSVMGVEKTLEVLKTLQEDCQHKITPRIVFNKYDGRELLSSDYLHQFATKYRSLLLKNMVKTSTDFKNAVASGRDLSSLRSAASDDIDDVTREMVGIDEAVQKPKRQGRTSEQAAAV